MYAASRGEGFGREVKRRIMLGNYALSAGYYDAYYLKALKVRRLIRDDFDRAFEACDLLLSPVTPTPAFKVGELIDDPAGDVSLRHLTPSARTWRGCRAFPFQPAGATRACRLVFSSWVRRLPKKSCSARPACSSGRRRGTRNGLRCEPEHELHDGRRAGSPRPAPHRDQALLRLRSTASTRRSRTCRPARSAWVFPAACR